MSKELAFDNFDKCIDDIKGRSIAKGLIRYNHKIYKVKANKIAMGNPIESDSKILDKNGIRAYPHVGNAFIGKIFDDKGEDIPNAIKELKKTSRFY